MLTIEILRQCAKKHNCKEAIEYHYCSRHHCRLIVKCNECGWNGEMRQTVHTYHGCGVTFGPDGEYDEDVEPVDECPECGSDNLIENEEMSK